MISVVMTVFNVEKYIEKSINSILSQTYSDLELIIVNDCTKDDSMKIVESFTDNRIRIINNSCNMGAGYSRRKGIESALGDYIITIDSDDWIEPNFLQNLYDKSKNSDLTFGAMIFDFENGQESVKFQTEFGTFFGMKKFDLMKEKKIIFLNTCLVKRHLYQKVKYDDKRYNEDTPTLAKLLFYANQITIVNEYGYHYIQQDKSLCHKTDDFFKHLCLLLTSLDLMSFFKTKPDNYKTLVTLNDVFLHMSYLTDLNKIKKYQEDFNKAMLGFINIIERT